jgi:hypothetical protein
VALAIMIACFQRLLHVDSTRKSQSCSRTAPCFAFWAAVLEPCAVLRSSEGPVGRGSSRFLLSAKGCMGLYLELTRRARDVGARRHAVDGTGFRRRCSIRESALCYVTRTLGWDAVRPWNPGRSISPISCGAGLSFAFWAVASESCAVLPGCRVRARAGVAGIPSTSAVQHWPAALAAGAFCCALAVCAAWPSWLACLPASPSGILRLSHHPPGLLSCFGAG